MTLVVATVSGSWTSLPGSTKSTSQVVIYAATDGGRLTLAGVGVLDGYTPIRFEDDGTIIPVDLPTTDQVGISPSGFKYLLEKRDAFGVYRSSPFDLTGDMTIDDIVETADGPITASLIARAEAAAAEAEDDAAATASDRTAADASAAAAAASAALAHSISGIATPDGVVGTLVGDTTPSGTRAAIGTLVRQHGGVVYSGDYASPQAAVNALATFGGGVVMLPYGPTYVDSGGIQLTSRVSLAGPPVRHTTNQLTQVDGGGFLRPQGISTSTGLAAYDGAYLVPTAGSTGPMVWADDFARSYSIKDLAIFGVDVYGTNITPPAKPSWATGKAAWVDANASTTSGSPTVTLSGTQAVSAMIGKTVTAAGVPGATTVTGYSAGANTITLSANATATASGLALTVSGGFAAPMVGQSGRQAISLGSGVAHNRTRGLIENVMIWGCGSGGIGATANNQTWTVTGAVTSGSNLITLTTQPSPRMVTAPITGTGIPANTTVVAVDPKNNIVALSANATASGGAVSLTIGGSAFTSALQQAYTGTPGIYVGSAEVILRGVSCFYGTGDGLVIDNQDCQIDADNLIGYNSGWGLRTTINSGPIRAPGAIDAFYNGIYGGAGNFLVEGAGHRFFSLQSNYPGTEHLKFGRAFDAIVYYFTGDSGGIYWANSGTRYSGVNFAAPAAATSNPLWNDGRNQGCQILGGQFSSSFGFEDHIITTTEAVVSTPLLVGLNFHATTVWNAGSPSNSPFALVQSYATNFHCVGCYNFPDTLVGGGGLGASVLATGNFDALDFVDTAGVVQSGVGARGAIFQRINSQALAANGAVTMDASRGNIQYVNLQANATSSSITNPKTGQVMTIEWQQDATGGRTYVWPTNCKFAGGSAPGGSTTSGYTDSVTFRYDGTNWKETSRSIAIR